MIIPIIAEAKSVEEVVNAINSNVGTVYFGGSDTHTREQLAAQYAQSALEKEYRFDGNIKDILEFLQDNGAQFDFDVAVKEAIELNRIIAQEEA